MKHHHVPLGGHRISRPGHGIIRKENKRQGRKEMYEKERLMRYTKTQLVDMLVKETAIGISRPADALEPILEALESLKFKEVECFVTISLSGSHKVIGTHIVSKGLVNQTIVHPREVFRPAIADNATAIIIAHNHPSGNNRPSSHDITLTKKVQEAGRVLDITLLDHIIVCPDRYHSFADNGML